MKQRIIATCIVVLLSPSAFAADTTAGEDTLWSSLLSWIDCVVEAVVGADSVDDEDSDPPSLWGTIDPNG